MSKKSAARTFVCLRFCARQQFHPRNDADAALAVARNFTGRRSMTIEEIEQNVAVDQGIQRRRLLRLLHSRRSVATWREIFPRVVDAPKNDRRSLMEEPARNRSTARRTASAREIFSRRQNNVSFRICSCGRSTMVRMTISSYVITAAQ